ncbi:hypothetical protein ARAF_2627 [Arsenophonus endosymbiont of Aleurodicus floccissimus]|uniref:hypothetical protein n=1 Tax=Arsenophonus endosymbiont of Aleurodicus floccissimus TaxID=2152761 RepID=UPI000EE93EC1|nr:hypothetical protein ARAF_2627 [Arsenophonus endosymbiont of Aleurodicus floccissimus]
MHRIDTSTAQKDKFGQGKNGFTNGDPTTGTPSTKLNSDIYDALQEEVCTVVERSGIRLNKSQLYHAIQKLSEIEANNAKTALIDGSTVDLNTLNKLAKALGNDPKLAETVTQQLSQKLAKNQNGADIPDKNLFLKNLGLLETMDCAKNALDKRTGGTINGNLHMTQSVHIGDNDSGLRANGDGNVALYANNVKVGEWSYKSLHWLGNAEVDGTINTHSNMVVSWVGRTSVYQENGDVHGPIWGGHLSGWLNNTFVCDIRLGHMQEIQIWKGPGYRDEPYYVITGVYNGNVDAYVDYVQRRIIQKNVNGNWINVRFM